MKCLEQRPAFQRPGVSELGPSHEDTVEPPVVQDSRGSPCAERQWEKGRAERPCPARRSGFTLLRESEVDWEKRGREWT